MQVKQQQSEELEKQLREQTLLGQLLCGFHIHHSCLIFSVVKFA